MRSTLQCGLVVLCSLSEIGLYAAACSSPAALAGDVLDKKVAVDIPVQPLSSAITLLSTQSGTRILISPGLAGDRVTNGVHGQMSIRDALSGLLRGSPLGFHAAGENTVDIDAVTLAQRGKSETPHDEARAAAPGKVQFTGTDTAAAADATGSKGAKAAATLGEIIVTATKREQSVRKIPATVDVLKGKDLEDIGARDMEDYLKYVPGITLQEGATGNNRTVSIRGIGPQGGANTTTGALIDDVSMSDPYSSYVVVDLDPFDLNDLEVLKGPQGTLFGASALNGAIRYVLNKPVLGVTEGKGFADWLKVQGAGSGPTFGGAFNIPLGDKIALRAVDVVQEVPGLYDDVNANGKNQKDADNGYKRMHRFMGLWQPTDELSVNAFYLQQAANRNDLSYANNVNDSFVRTDTPGQSSLKEQFSVENLDIRYSFDWFTAISETSRTNKLQNFDIDTSNVLEPLATEGIPSARTSGFSNSKSFMQELRLVSSPGGPWVWIAGAYLNRYTAAVDLDIYLADTQGLNSLLNGLGVPPSLTSVLVPTSQGVSITNASYLPLKASEESLFGELTRKLGSRLSVTLGGRLYRESLHGTIDVDGLLGPFAGIDGYNGEKSMKASGFNPKATATYQLTDQVLWYANGSHGFQFGGLNEPAALPTEQIPSTYKPSSIWSYETGVRTDAFHKTLQFDLTAFLLNWKNMQIQQKTSDGLTTYTDNIGTARSKGVESSIRYLTPIPGLMLVNVASYIHAKAAAPYETATGQMVPVGADLPASPRLQTATTLAYNAGFGPVRAGAGLTLSHEGHAFSNITHDAVIYGYNTLDANFNLTCPYLPLAPAITLNLTNLTDAHAVIGENISDLEGLSSSTQTIYNRPRAIAVRISGKF